MTLHQASKISLSLGQINRDECKSKFLRQETKRGSSKPQKDCEFGEEVGKFYRNKRNKVLLFKSKQMLRIIVAAAVQQNGKSGGNKEKKDCQ